MVDRGICAVDPCQPEVCLSQPKVIIIGAGMAGISAAARLVQRGISNFLILEALERLLFNVYTLFYNNISIYFLI